LIFGDEKMSLGIFSFDLAAIIDSLSNFIETGEPETAPSNNEISLDKTAAVLQNASAADSVIDDVLMAAALNSAVTSVISSTEIVKKESTGEKNMTAKPTVRPAPGTLDEATRKEIERLIKSLQISVIHNYKSTDIIDESVSLNTVLNFPKRKLPDEPDNNSENVEQQKKREESKLLRLREELKKAILKNNAEV
jgi:hypothetical protein